MRERLDGVCAKNSGETGERGGRARRGLEIRGEITDSSVGAAFSRDLADSTISSLPFIVHDFNDLNGFNDFNKSTNSLIPNRPTIHSALCSTRFAKTLDN